MSRFLKIDGESAWVNIERIDAIFVRPQLAAVGQSSGVMNLEELHQVTGHFEVVVMFQGQSGPAKTFANRTDAETFVEELLGQLSSG